MQTFRRVRPNSLEGHLDSLPESGVTMLKTTLNYGTTAKVFHRSIVALVVVQYLLGWFLPDIHRDMKPGPPMTFHISVGIMILLLMVLRLLWRITHPVSLEPSLPPWQKWTSESVHWLLYGLVLATTLTGWSFASFRDGQPLGYLRRLCQCWLPNVRRLPARSSPACNT